MKCPIGAGFAISGFRRKSAVLATASVGDKPTIGVVEIRLALLRHLLLKVSTARGKGERLVETR
jgi:hypothetical protein